MEEQSRQRVIIRRRAPFRLTSSRKTAPVEKEEFQPHLRTESVECEMIDEEEERERLAGLQMRERLVKNLDLPQTLSFLLASPQSPPPFPTSTLTGTLPLRRPSSTHQPLHVTYHPPLTRPPITKSGSVDGIR